MHSSRMRIARSLTLSGKPPPPCRPPSRPPLQLGRPPWCRPPGCRSPLCGQKEWHACENITFPQLLFRAAKMWWKFHKMILGCLRRWESDVLASPLPVNAKSVLPPLEYLPTQPSFVKYHSYVPSISQNFGGESQKQPLRITPTGAINNKKY